MTPIIFQANLSLFGYGPSLVLWWWHPEDAERRYEIKRRYLTAHLGRLEIDLQWL